MDGDTVIARVMQSGYDDRQEGKIIRILNRAHHKLVGTFSKSGEFGFVIPDNKRVGRDIYVRRKDFNGARDKEKVVVEITTWPDERRNAEGKIVEILGKPGDIGLEILSIIKDNDLPTIPGSCPGGRGKSGTEDQKEGNPEPAGPAGLEHHHHRRGGFQGPG